MVTQLVRESKNNVDGKAIGILIFDYKGDYVGDDFKKATGAEVFELFHLPYNPLAIDVHENALPLLPLHVASTIKETISKAYNLGKKQEQALRSVIMDAYEDKGIHKANRDTWTKPEPTISDVCKLFKLDEKVAQDSLYAALDNLHEFEIFEPDSSKTKSLFDLLNGVMVINLSGYDESIQNLVVAITLDLFYSQMQKAGHSKIDGDFRQLNKMILVDEADNFLSKNFNSIRKILKEGREFGVGTILSTQFLSHFSTSDNDYSTYILTWIVHRVNEIKSKEVDALFKLDSKEATNELMNEIKSLDKHYSVVNLAGSPPIFIKDRAFWELMLIAK
jgi:DNA phosphorothioation-dependent restriction protein DptH